MNPTTPKAHRITPGAVIQHPCWLRFKHNQQWNRFERPPDPFSLPLAMFDEWHEDQPHAPTSIPSPVSSQDSEGTAPDAIDEVIAEVYRLFGKPTDRDDMMQAEVLLRTMLTEKFGAAPRPNQPAQEAVSTGLTPYQVALKLMGENDPSNVDKWQEVRELEKRLEAMWSEIKPSASPEASGEVREADPTSLLTSAERLHQAISVVLKDWKDGDFVLPRLAEIHMEAVREKYLEVGKALAFGEASFQELQKTIALSKPAAPMLPGGGMALSNRVFPGEKTSTLQDYRAALAPPLPGGTLVDGKDGE